MPDAVVPTVVPANSPDTDSETGSLPLHDPDLANVVAAWPDLPEAIKAGIVAMVKAVGGSGV